MRDANISSTALINIGELPSVPQVLLKLIDSCHDVDASFSELAQAIRQDAALCAKIISVANTPAYAQWNGIKDFNRLVVVLGLEPIKSISITAIVQQFFSQFDSKLGQCMGLLWGESLTCAHTAKVLAHITGYPSEDEAYLTGLLHNIGKLAILKQKPDDYTTYLLNDYDQQNPSQFERDLVGASSAEIGARILAESTHDSFVSDAIHFQTIDAEQILDSSHLIKLINLAYKLTMDGFHTDEVAEIANQLFGLNQGVLDDMAASVGNSVRSTAAAYGIELSKKSPPNLDNQESRLELAKRVKGFALLHGVARESVATESATTPWEEVARNLKILFGLDSAVVFEPNSDTSLLRTTATFNAGLIPEPLTVPAHSSQSIISKAAKSGTPIFDSMDTDESKVSVLDHQLKRLLGADALVAIPLTTNDAFYGVIATGIKSDQLDHLMQSSEMMLQYVQAAARNMHQFSQAKEQRETEIEALQLQRTADTRELIHEANNPIGVIKNYLHVLSAKLEDNDEISQQLDTVKAEIDRVGSIIARMRDVGQTKESSTETVSPININQVIRSLISIYSSSIFITHNITENLVLDNSIESIDLKKSSLKQILTNLIKNAIEAMPEGGTIGITTHDNIIINGNPHIEIRIVDSGTGIPNHMLKDVFTPVKSTKGPTHSGLGLSIVMNLISEMNGTISVQNNKNCGTEFVLHLPKRN